jgi:hypothetical protein
MAPASCIRGTGDEESAERPVLTVTQVFELAERVGREDDDGQPGALASVG